MVDSLAGELEERLEALGYELVEMERAGSAKRPILRLRIDTPGSAPGAGVTLDDCTRASRALEAYLDERPGLAETYVLEVSSPGVERPLVKAADFQRFAGSEVVVQGKTLLAGRAKRLEGVLVGLAGEGEAVALRLPGGDEVEIPREQVTRAHLLYRWGGEGRKA